MRISFSLIGLLVTTVMLTGEASAAPDANPDTNKALTVSQAAIGVEVGDYPLTDSSGQILHIAQFRGKPLLIQFVYTSCSQACPVSVKYLERGVRAARAALGDDAFSVITIGFNQPFDTPEAMGAFARRFGLVEPGWHFASGDDAVVQELTQTLGFTWYTTPKGFDHIAQVTVLDAQGRVYRQVYGEQFEVPVLVEPLKDLVTGQQERASDWRAFVEKVRLFCTIYDNTSGTYRIDYSLFVEIFVGASILGAIGFMFAGEWRRNRQRH